MSIKNVKTSVKTIARSLESSRDDRVYLIKHTRDAISLCSQSIIAVHGQDLPSAKKKVIEAKCLIKKFRPKAVGILAKYLSMPEQEYTEAMAIIAIAEKKQIPSHKSLTVSGDSYVLGLLDCIGEMKRMMLDMTRRGNLKDAEIVFGTMEDLFAQLYPFAALDKVVKEARRKLDVNRMILESSRTVITEEIRRAEFVKALKEKSLK
ncbi:MAG: translin family protein [Cenarchaeum symbiont of Oopsacas minuta]|nr:translin family protein [Cenarchaeum symbiont of Oopsacas minuta]